MYCNATNCVKTIVYVVAMLHVKSMFFGVAINFRKITVILQPARNDVKIGPA